MTSGTLKGAAIGMAALALSGMGIWQGYEALLDRDLERATLMALAAWAVSVIDRYAREGRWGWL